MVTLCELGYHRYHVPVARRT